MTERSLSAYETKSVMQSASGEETRQCGEDMRRFYFLLSEKLRMDGIAIEESSTI